MSKEHTSYETALAEMQRESPDVPRALALLQEAVQGADPRASYALGTWFLHGTHVARDVRKATKLIRVAADANVVDALFDLAVAYETGVGVRKNLKLAARHYLRAALHGSDQATFEVGRCYYYGIGFERDRPAAKIWLDRAEELGIYESAS